MNVCTKNVEKLIFESGFQIGHANIFAMTPLNKKNVYLKQLYFI